MNILITGGTHGIGKAIAESFGSEDRVFVVARNKPAELSNNHFFISADLTKKDDIDYLCERIEDESDLLTYDILVNNAGGGGRWGKESVLDTEECVWQEVWNKNYEAARKLTLAVLPYMKLNNFGRVVTISSICGKEALGRPWFNVAKAAEIILMKSLSKQKDLVRSNITFNTVCPGATYIPGTGWDNMSDEDFASFENSLPLGRLASPEEVAYVVKFLCSKEGSLLNGSCITVDGGESLYY